MQKQNDLRVMKGGQLLRVQYSKSKMKSPYILNGFRLVCNIELHAYVSTYVTIERLLDFLLISIFSNSII